MVCGIFVVYKFDSNKYTLDDLRKGVDAVNHRGPDNQGVFASEHCFLGHTRLSIIDTLDHANQPFYFDQFVMVYNGEIFNYIELREELQKLGYVFSTTSDTEVVLKAYHAWKEQCFDKFNGMWALAIYNLKTHELIVSGDRFGQKPLFVMDLEGGFFIASEIQQLTPFSNKDLNYGVIQMFLKDGTYEETPGKTFFKDIEKYPKASFTTFSLDKPYQTKRYWDYPDRVTKNISDESYIHFQELLDDAVKIRLRSDVPYGLLLSGGVDSTVIAGISAKFPQEMSAVPAFVYASGDQDDESRYASEVATALGMELEIVGQDVNPQDYILRLRAIVRHLGGGHSSPAVVSVDRIYECVSKRGIRVALDGQGADEVMAGYKIDFPLRMLSFLFKGYFKQTKFIFNELKKSGFFLFLVYFFRFVCPPSIKKVMRMIFGYEGLFVSYPLEPVWFRGDDKGISRNQTFLHQLSIRRHAVGLANLLYYGDILAMKNSVENRSPFMDHRLVELVFQMEDHFSVLDGKAKYPLRILDEYKRFSTLLDRNKIGFSSDIRLNTKKEMVRMLEASPILSWPIFNQKSLRAIVSGDLIKPKYERFLFRLFQVHLFYEIFVCDSVKKSRESDNAVQHC